jgi:hypothetical protein
MNSTSAQLMIAEENIEVGNAKEIERMRKDEEKLES